VVQSYSLYVSHCPAPVCHRLAGPQHGPSERVTTELTSDVVPHKLLTFPVLVKCHRLTGSLTALRHGGQANQSPTQACSNWRHCALAARYLATRYKTDQVDSLITYPPALSPPYHHRSVTVSTNCIIIPQCNINIPARRTRRQQHNSVSIIRPDSLNLELTVK